MLKTYYCCICHQEIDKEEAVRLTEQLYGISHYNMFTNSGNKFDFCTQCYKKFTHWIKKHEGDNDE